MRSRATARPTSDERHVRRDDFGIDGDHARCREPDDDREDRDADRENELRASDLARLSDRIGIARDVDAEIAERFRRANGVGDQADQHADASGAEAPMPADRFTQASP